MAPEPAGLSGRVIRTFKKTPRMAIERFILDLDRSTWDRGISPGIEDSEVIVDTQQFDFQPLSSPVVIYSRRVADASELNEALEYFTGNISVTVPRPPIEFVDATVYEPLDEEDFWPIIDSLEGKLWEQTIARAARLLSAESEEFILRFAQRSAFLAFQLDHPASFDDSPTHDGEPGVSSRHNQHTRGSVIGGGRGRFESVLANPGAVDSRWVTDSAPQVLHLASHALTRKRRASVLVETTWDSRRIGLSRANWEGSGIALDPQLDPPSREETELIEAEAIRAVSDQDEGAGRALAAYFSAPRGRLVTARFLVEVTGDVFERVLLLCIVRGPQEAGETTAVEAASAHARSLGGALVSPVDFYDTHYGRPMSGQIFEIKRRSSPPEDAYLARFVRR